MLIRVGPVSASAPEGRHDARRAKVARKTPKHARPRIQRAFLHWLEEAGDRFNRPITILRRTDDVIEFNFDVGGSALVAWLNRYEVEVGAFLDDQCWDLIYSNWIDVRKDEDVYYCGACPLEYQRRFDRREDLWRHELFEPFLHWVNTRLAIAQELRLYQSEEGGITWAELADGDTDKIHSGLAATVSLE